MNISPILEYQKIDSELFKIERLSKDNNNRKIAFKMQDNAKEAQQRSVVLEKKAGDLLAEIEVIKQKYESQVKAMNQFLNKDLEKMQEEEIQNMLSVKDKLMQNISFLDKNLTKLAESVNLVLADFNKTIKIFNDAKEKYNNSKALYDQDMKEIEPKKKELEANLADAEKQVPKEMLETYQKRRQDNIFPVLVPIRENSCGGCSMQLPAATISKLEEKGFLPCEHCRRIIYLSK